MNAMRTKKAKAKSRAKSNKVKTRKATASAALATAAAAAPQANRDVGALIKNLDVASLQNDDITSILLHCASALNLRKVIDRPGATMEESSASYCYTKSGDSSTVSIWSGGFKVGESSEAEAKSSGIPPCG
jgi:hypothetical protein